MTRLVDRFGRTGFAALTSLIWGLPMAAWAGSSDLSPIDQTAYPWVALIIGVVMFIVWLILVARIRKTPVTQRTHRLEIRQMSGPEKRWLLAFAAFGTIAIAWLNAAATVDWTPLITAIKDQKPAPILFTVIALAFLVAMLTGAAICWQKAAKAFEVRRSRPS